MKWHDNPTNPNNLGMEYSPTMQANKCIYRLLSFWNISKIMARFHGQRYHFRGLIMTLNFAHLDIAHFGSRVLAAFSKRVHPQTGWREKRWAQSRPAKLAWGSSWVGYISIQWFIGGSRSKMQSTCEMRNDTWIDSWSFLAILAIAACILILICSVPPFTA